MIDGAIQSIHLSLHFPHSRMVEQWGVWNIILWIIDFLLFINKLLYSLPPSVGQSAEELKQQVTSGKPGCNERGCPLPVVSPLEVEAFTAAALKPISNAPWVKKNKDWIPPSVQVPPVSLWSRCWFCKSLSSTFISLKSRCMLARYIDISLNII